VRQEEPMPTQKISREFIINQAIKIFKRKSYHNTTMADIADACGVLKGSIYHYFQSKEVLMKAVIEHVHQYFKDNVFIHAQNGKLGASQKMEQLVDMAENLFFGPEGGDILGNVGIETAHVIPEFREPIRQFFTDYMSALETIFKEKYPGEMAKELAVQSISEVEGALMLSRIFGDRQYFIDANRRLIEKLN